MTSLLSNLPKGLLSLLRGNKSHQISPILYSASAVTPTPNSSALRQRSYATDIADKKNSSLKLQSKSSTVEASLKDKIVVAEVPESVFYHPKHDMYICWHPEVPFPYEMSRPIPAEIPGTESNLKIQALVPVKEVFRKKNERLMVRELIKLTHTTKYRWLGKYGMKKRTVFKGMDPLKEKRDREYL